MTPEQRERLAELIAEYALAGNPYVTFTLDAATLAELLRKEAAHDFIAALARENAQLRQMLWLAHGHDGLYGDDGEMQCGQCCIDFKRWPVADIERRMRDNARRKLAEQQAATLAPTKEEA